MPRVMDPWTLPVPDRCDPAELTALNAPEPGVARTLLCLGRGANDGETLPRRQRPMVLAALHGYDAGSSVSVATVAASIAAGVNGNGKVVPLIQGPI